MPELPTGTVTLLFTDIEGSTRLLHELGPAGYGAALAEHRRLLRDAFARHGGIEVDTQGDAFFVAFADSGAAADAAVDAQHALASGSIRARMGLHTGQPSLAAEGYVGHDVHLGARICAAGHGGQVLMSAATRETLTADSQLRDLGEHRLKDFPTPIWIYQLGSERFPPLKTISNTNLPRPAASFVGRGRDVAEIIALLRDSARLVTLTGPGGTGKTRLAIEAGAELVPDFRNGTFWVDVAAVFDPNLVAETIAATLGATGGLVTHIGEREMLLVLDNLEQVIDAAPQLAALVERCPNLRLLATSRERLRVRGEVEYAVPPLAEHEAVDLFCQRSVLPPGEAIAELCRRLDNLPLAVELAAARTSVLSPAQILERLAERLDLLKGGRDAEARQKTLRATIEWSYDLLDGDEQRLFARLSVFRGSFTLKAAEEVAGADLDPLQSLVDKNLVRHTGDRFSMLETIREYAAERLENSGNAGELSRRHAQHFLRLGEEAEPNLFGGEESAEWLDRLGREHDNLRAAMDYLQVASETQAVLRLAGAVWAFWRDRAYFAEGRRRLERALGADERPTRARAKALNAAGSMAIFSGDAASGRVRAEEALSLHLMLGNEKGTAESELWLGWAVANEGDWRRAQLLLEGSTRRFLELRDEHQALLARNLLAMTYAELGQRERARALDEENLRRARELRNRQLEATTLDQLARHTLDEGRIEDALSLAAESLRVYHGLGDPHGVAIELRRCSWVIALGGRARVAARLLASADVLQEEIGGTMPWLAMMKESALATIRVQLDEATFAEAWDEGRMLTADEAVALVLAELG